jgi:hypothetical protein
MARVARFVLVERKVEPLTLATAKGLHAGVTLYSTHYRNADGTSSKARVTSVQTWKTRPGEVRVNWKHGMKIFGHETEYTLDRWSLEPTWELQPNPLYPKADTPT